MVLEGTPTSSFLVTHVLMISMTCLGTSVLPNCHNSGGSVGLGMRDNPDFACREERFHRPPEIALREAITLRRRPATKNVWCEIWRVRAVGYAPTFGGDLVEEPQERRLATSLEDRVDYTGRLSDAHKHMVAPFERNFLVARREIRRHPGQHSRGGVDLWVTRRLRPVQVGSGSKRGIPLHGSSLAGGVLDARSGRGARGSASLRRRSRAQSSRAPARQRGGLGSDCSDRPRTRWRAGRSRPA